MNRLLERISVNPQVCGGKPCIKGTRTILEPGPRTTPQRLLDRVRELLAILDVHELKGSLWIVEPGRVRIHERRSNHC